MGLFSSSEPASHFPAVQGRRLDGTDVAFPDDLSADATLLIVLFRDDLDPLADQWARLGDRLADAYEGRVDVIEAPVVNKKLKMFGKLSTLGIRGQVDGEAERDRTVPLFVDVKSFRKELQFKTTGDVYALLLARDGRIVWRGEGDIDMDEVEELEAAVREMLDAAEASPDHDEQGEAPGHEPGAEADRQPAAELPAEAQERSRQNGRERSPLGDEPPPVRGAGPGRAGA